VTQAKIEECLKLLAVQRVAVEALRAEVSNVSTFYQCVLRPHQLLEDLQLVANRLKLLASAVCQMRKLFRELKPLDPAELNESRDSLAEYVSSAASPNPLFTKAATESDFYDARKKFLLVPIE